MSYFAATNKRGLMLVNGGSGLITPPDAAMILALVLVTDVPAISLWLPSLLKY